MTTQLSFTASDFKIRASSAHEIMGGELGLTDTQEETLSAFEARIKDGKKPLTPKQTAEYQRLSAKKANPELPAGAKTHCKGWLKEKVFNRKKLFTSKYTDKGIHVEESSLLRLSEYYSVPIIKNDEFYEDNDFTGTPDVVLPIGIDAKNPWDFSTFPLFEDSLPGEYFYQGQVYMSLTGLKTWQFAYVLSDTPDPLIMQEARKWCMLNGEEMSPSIYDEFKARLTYNDVPDEFRIKTYTVEYDEAIVDEMRLRVKMCREYIAKEIDKFVETINRLNGKA